MAPKLPGRRTNGRLLHFQSAIMIVPGNVRPCRGQSHVPVFGLPRPDTGADGLYSARDHEL